MQVYSEKNYVTCPNCGKKIVKDFRFCIYCGYINPQHPANKELIKRGIKKVDKKRQDKNGKGIDLDSYMITDGVLHQKTNREKIYSLFHKFRSIILFLFIIVLGMIVYGLYTDLKSNYVDDAKEIAYAINNKFKYNCNSYYITFTGENDLMSKFNLNIRSKVNKELYTGYLYVNNGTYYITLYDGVFGIDRVNVNSLDNGNVKYTVNMNFNNISDGCDD